VSGKSHSWSLPLGGQARPASNTGLAPGATNTFHLVVTADKPFTTTNLTAKVQFSRIVLAGGKLADPVEDAQLERE
jgi:hypothetical protein